MGRQIITQPDGLYAIFSTSSDAFEHYDMTKEEVIDLFTSEAAEEASRRTSEILRQLEDSGPRSVYRQFAETFDEAYDKHLGGGYGVLKFEAVDGFEYEQCPHCKEAKRVGVECMSQNCMIRRDEED